MDVQELVNAFDDLMNMTDPDGVCENGCTCGECENCLELERLQDILSMWKK